MFELRVLRYVFYFRGRTRVLVKRVHTSCLTYESLIWNFPTWLQRDKQEIDKSLWILNWKSLKCVWNNFSISAFHLRCRFTPENFQVCPETHSRLELFDPFENLQMLISGILNRIMMRITLELQFVWMQKRAQFLQSTNDHFLRQLDEMQIFQL